MNPKNGQLPFSPGALPGPNAELEELIGFAYSYDHATYFHDEWGVEYPERARALWCECVDAFREGEPPMHPVAQLFLCFHYDCVLGDALGVPLSHKRDFLQWLLAAIREAPCESSQRGAV